MDYQVKSVERALTILKCFAPGRTELSLAEIAGMTALHKSSVFRLLVNLQRQGFIQATDSGKYTVGIELRRLGQLWHASEALVIKARRILRILHDLSGETTFLVEYDRGRALCTDRIETSKALKITSQIGSMVPLFKGASGKSITAFLNDSERKLALSVQGDIYQEQYEIDTLHREFSDIQKSGYACTSGEVDEGVTAFSVPLLTPEGRVLGSISIAGPTFRFSDMIMDPYRSEVLSLVQGQIW
jgi:DNA-binding IclR family transcriptional regulator